MQFRKTGFPEEHEIVLCTVTKVQYHSVFVKLEEFNLVGMVHISEIAAGRIRNIRDYVKEGKVIVCKVLRVNKDKGQVDLSLRRVSETQRRGKVNGMKHEQRAEGIIDFVAKQQKIDKKKLYDEVSEAIFTDYEYLFEAFEDVVEKGLSLESLGVKKNIAAKLEEVIKQRIKPKEVQIKGKIHIELYTEDGVDTIKKTLVEAEKPEKLDISYVGGGTYMLQVKAKDYKKAEPIVKEAVDKITKAISKHKGTVKFERQGK